MNRTVAAAALAVLACMGGVAAQEFPSKPIVMLVPFAAGGPTDVVGRALGQVMSKSMKQPVVIENAVGAGGTLAGIKLTRSAPDGYTTLLMHIGMATAPALYRNLAFKPETDMQAVGLIVDTPMTLIAKPGMPAANLKELIAYVRANKDKVALANAGLGAASHLCGLLFMSAIQVELTTVPYKGTGPALNDILGGQVDLLCDQTTNTTSYIKAGRVKVYGITSLRRVPSLANIPTLHEQGLTNFEVGVWNGLYVPKGTPKAVVDKLAAALQDAARDAQFKARMAELGAEVYPPEKVSPAIHAAHLKAEIAKWTPIIRKAGVYAD